MPPSAPARGAPPLPYTLLPGVRPVALPSPLALVAGASGRLGTEVVHALLARGWRVRALTRDAARYAAAFAGQAPAGPGGGGTRVATGGRIPTIVEADLTRPDVAPVLARACEGVDVVVSCAGAPLALRGPALRDRRPFAAVDREGNLRLVREAGAAGARRFVYVSLHGGRALRHTAYAAAHEAVADALAAAPLPAVVVRPTGFFSFFDELLVQAAAGRAVVVGDGRARTNPVHEADVAAVVAAACDPAEPVPAAGALDVEVGGPTTYTREEIVARAFEAVGRRAPAVWRLPGAALRWSARLLAPVHPRLAALVDFGAAVSLVDAVAPAVGTRELGDHFDRRVRELRLRAP